MQHSPSAFSPLARAGAALLCSGLLCSGLALAQAPANDEACTAIEVFGGLSATFDSTNATDSPEPTLCGTFVADVWFKYTATASGVLVIDTCTGTTFDTKLEAFDGTPGCASLAGSLVCNDDSCSLQSSVTVSAVSGTEYLIRVGGFGGATGTFQLDVNLVVPPTNDDCANAITVADGVNGPYSNVLSGPSLPVWACSTGASDVWFEYTATCTGPHTFSACGANFDTIMELFENGCSALSSLDCNDDACSLQSEITFFLFNGTTYHLRVGGFGGAQGNFPLNISGPSTGAGTIALHSASLCSGGLSMTMTGDPNIGGSLTATMSGYTGAAFITFGLPPLTTPLMPACNCVLLTNLTDWILSDTISVNIPCMAGFIGIPLSAQGADLFGSTPACTMFAPGAFTDVWAATIG